MRNMTRMAAAAAVALVLAAPVRAGEADFANNDEKTAYALGLSLANLVRDFDLSPREFELVKRGLEDGQARREPAVPYTVWGPRVEGLRDKRMREAAVVESREAARFLDKAAAEPGAIKTPSGLVYRELVAGTGASPKRSDRVKVRYHGTLRDGTVFDSTRGREQAAMFRLDGVIACWTEALQRMKVGGKSELTCPAEIGYGAKGAPPKIRPNAALHFEVELLAIEG